MPCNIDNIGVGDTVNSIVAYSAGQQNRASNAYREDFGRHLRGRPLVHNVLSESVDADGGYLVPEEFEHNIIKGLDETNIIRSVS